MTVKELRTRMNMTQRVFAEYLGIPLINIQHWEQGVSQPPAYVKRLIERVIYLENISISDRGNNDA